MTLPLTPERLAAVYDCLRAFPPFSAWGLPDSDGVAFKISRDWDTRGHYQGYASTLDDHTIAINDRFVGHLDTTMAVMAHEMIHLYQQLAKTTTPNTEHNAEFWRLARAVCRRFGFDPKAFL